MKKDNRYSRAIEQIVPDENFVNETVKKLTDKKPRRSLMKYALPAAAALTVVAIAVSAFPKLLNRTGAPASKPDAVATQTVSTDPSVSESKDKSASADLNGATNEIVSRSALAPQPTSMPLPTWLDNFTLYEMYEDTEAPGEGYVADYETSYWASEAAFASIPWNTEEYSFIKESGFRYVSSSPLSTFAADVDTAGYTTVRRKLLEQTLPSASAVRIEEMLNYFHYTGLAPVDSAPAAISAYLGACPWNENAALMFVGIGAQRIETENLPKSNLVFLIDTSGSMDGSDRLDLAKRAFHLLIDTLSEGDTVSVVTYSGSFRVLLEGVDAANKTEILDAIDSLEAYGCTNGGDAIVTAYDIARKYFIDGGNNRVIMMTDGDLNVGITSQSELVSLVEEKKNSGVFLSVLGFGMGNYKDSKLEALADHGNGVYSYIDGITEARRTLVTEMGANFYTVAKDVKIQVEFNPEYVSSYRLIGYENRQMAAEDFADDTKDGGEMGSGHTVVALYEIIPAEGKELAGAIGKAQESNVPDLKYQSAQAGNIAEVAQVSIRYKEPDGDASSLISVTVRPEDIAEGEQARNLNKAAAIAEFGMLLRDSEYKGSATYDSAFELVSKLENLSEEESELLYLISTAKGLQ